MEALLKTVKVDARDNVAILTRDLPKGTLVENDVLLWEDIPQSHKVALEDIPANGKIIRYHVLLGYAKTAIKKGQWINEDLLILPKAPSLNQLRPGNHVKRRDLPPLPRTTFEGYRNSKNEFAGTRNILAIHTTVQCVVGVLNVAVRKIRKEILPRYPHVDDVMVVNHAYGCGVAINAPDAKIPIRALHHLLEHPNFGGEVMVVALGCEKLRPEMMMGPELINSENLIVLQDFGGFQEMLAAICAMAEKKLTKLNERRRETLPLSQLLVGMQCGGSDAFSGVTANPSAGFASDLLVAAGATVMFSEVTEVRDGVELLADRITSAPVCDKLVSEMRWYDQYLDNGKVDRSANPTPGNKKGGLSTIVEKAMGSIAKSGTSEIVEVLSPGEIPTKHGLIYAATPASDFVCGTMQMCSGAAVQVFVTGRGTPYGLQALPVIKLCTRSDLKQHWDDIIDIDAGAILTGEKTLAEMGVDVFNYIVDVASGTKKPFTETYHIYNDVCVFNPAPIT